MFELLLRLLVVGIPWLGIIAVLIPIVTVIWMWPRISPAIRKTGAMRKITVVWIVVAVTGGFLYTIILQANTFFQILIIFTTGAVSFGLLFVPIFLVALVEVWRKEKSIDK